MTLLNSSLLTVHNVLHYVLLPSLPSLTLLRHTYSQMVAVAVQQQQHHHNITALDNTIGHKRQRISLLGKVLSVLTSEGNRVGPLLQAVQDALRLLPHIRSSAVTCRDVVIDSVIYEASMVYSADGASAPTTQSSNVYSASTASTPVSRTNTAVSYVDAAHPAAHSQLSTPVLTPLDPNNSSTRDLLVSADYSRATTGLASGKKLFNQLSSPAVYRNVTASTPANHNNNTAASSNSSTVVEYVFECYEVQGTLTVHMDGLAATSGNNNGNSATPGVTVPDGVYFDAF